MKPDTCPQEHLLAARREWSPEALSKESGIKRCVLDGVLEFSGGGCEFSGSAAAAALISIY